MKKQEVTRLYKFSDATLVALGKEKIAFMRRDLEAFTSFGITVAMISDLESNLIQFSDGITDIEALSDQTGVTENKTNKAEQLRVAIRNVMTRVELKYGTNSARYKKFGTGAISQLSDPELFITGKRVVRVGTEFLDDLASHGLTTEMLINISSLCYEFENLMLDLQVKMSERDIIQEDRVEAGNAVYATLVSYTTTGRSIWETTDVAKYNDYIIYDTVSGEAPIVPTAEIQ
ncbi:hypothetical protein [Flavobacterium limnosediminis]|nr:hypothetical protein [Flavobacterium limnosediminis]